MIRWLTLLVWLLVLPAQTWAQAALVTSGDHPDFTRIVVQYAGPVDWKVGRTVDGYELRLPQADMRYDLSKAFDLIQKNRLAAIWNDPKTGVLHLTIACACFAIPFEFRPGTVVIDIRNGTPPKGSGFEVPLDGGSVAALKEPNAVLPQKIPPKDAAARYDWTDVALQPRAVHQTYAGADPGLSGDGSDPAPLDLEPLRQSLIEKLSRGASAGIVDMALPKHSLPDSADPNPNPSVEVRSGDAPNLVLRQKGEADTPMTAKGEACFADKQLDVSAWAMPLTPTPEAKDGAAPAAATHAEKPAAAAAPEKAAHSGEPATDTSIGGPIPKEAAIVLQFAPAMANLTGEFDRADSEAVRRAVRFDLYIGFGAEARALMRAFPVEEEDKPIWQSMARITDEEPDPNPVFSGMEACDTAAALWAVLADPKILGIGQVQKSAVLRAFSALPAHLRQLFGPTLVDRFLAMQDFATATVLRDAATRGILTPGAEVELMQAAIDKASGSPGASVTRLEAVAAESGPSNADAMVALVLQRAELGQEVSYDQVKTIEEYAKEHSGSQDHEKFQQALTLAYAASGDFDHAFSNLANGPDAAAVLWKLLGNAGPDSALLNYATLEEAQEPPRSARASAGLIADRLLRLGLADQAARWLTVAIDPPPLLAARIAVAQGLPQQALDLLGDLKSAAAVQVKLDALQQMGDEPAIAAMFADLGMTQEHWDAVSRMQNWQSLAADGPDVWKAAAATLSDQAATAPDPEASPLPADGPLTRGQALITESAATRDAIAALLTSVKSPVVPSQ